MKTITLNVSEPVYKEFKEYAKRQDRTTSELIREAMATYIHERAQDGKSLGDLPPVQLGRVLKPLNKDVDTLGEMTRDTRY
jgi:Ribbon-helix-helix protein, copG family